VGKAQDVTLTVVYADRAQSDGEVSRRTILARKSNRREREAYNKAANAK